MMERKWNSTKFPDNNNTISIANRVYTNKMSQPTEVKCYWASNVHEPLTPSTITRRAAAPGDVVIGVEYAGICHSDIHQARNEWQDNWGPGIFPM